ncbi:MULTISPECIES: hypothetical protein [Actinomyces]|uniref:hypothetical protein n=1 Tax=Actinomyces sp. ZJ751 TaxID=2708341 RepID=UPI001F38246F|nr:MULTISPECIES: hypothetical protein [Actinomyces]
MRSPSIRGIDWFCARFDLAGDDGVLVDGVSGFDGRLKVLEVHGVEDGTCPAFLADDVAGRWAELGNPWERVWLPGKGHNASTLEDVRTISAAVRTFVCRLLPAPED